MNNNITNFDLEKLIAKSEPEFKNEKKSGVHILTLSGVIGQPSNDADKSRYFSAKKVRDALDGVKEDIVIRMNSVGGSVFDGIEIYNYLKKLPNKVTVEVTALAASAASIIAMGADEVIMNTGSQMMIHQASGVCIGNKKNMDDMSKTLNSIDDSLISIYHNRTKQTSQQIKKWIETETWFTAEEAVKYRFANEVTSILITNNSTGLANIKNKTAYEKYIKKGNVSSPQITRNKTAFEKYIKKGNSSSSKNKTGLQKLFNT